MRTATDATPSGRSTEANAMPDPIWAAEPADPARRCCPTCLGTGAVPSVADTTGTHPEAEPDCELQWEPCGACGGRGWQRPSRRLRHAPAWRTARKAFLERDEPVDGDGRTPEADDDGWNQCHIAHRQGRSWRALRAIERARGEREREDCPVCDGTGRREIAHRRRRGARGTHGPAWLVRFWSSPGTIRVRVGPCDACRGVGAMAGDEADGWIRQGHSPAPWADEAWYVAAETCGCPPRNDTDDIEGLLRAIGPKGDERVLLRVLGVTGAAHDNDIDTQEGANHG